jgi:molybdenum cofactor guanylyltransferase
MMPRRAGCTGEARVANNRVLGVILAGGRSTRMAEICPPQGSKAHLTLADKPLIDHVVERLRPQVASLVINANDDPAAYGHLDVTVIADLAQGYPGPLVGLASALIYNARQNPPFELVALASCDAPFLPKDLVAVLAKALDDNRADVACPRYQGYLQPTFSLWRSTQFSCIDYELTTLGKGGLRDLLTKLDCTVVDWPSSPLDPFFNINTPAQLRQAQSFCIQGTST